MAILSFGLNDVMGATVAAHACSPLKLIGKETTLQWDIRVYKGRPFLIWRRIAIETLEKF